MSERTDLLIHRYLDGACGPGEVEELRAELGRSPQTAERLFRVAEDQVELAAALREGAVQAEPFTSESRRAQRRASSTRSSARASFAPVLLAAALLLATTVFFVFLNARSAPAGNPAARSAPDPEERASAVRDLAAREEALRKAEGELARIERERRETEERLAELERRARELAAQSAAVAPPEEPRRTAEDEQARQAEQERIEAQRRAEEARLAESREARSAAEEDLIRAEVARKEAERRAAAKPSAPEVGQVVFVLETGGHGQARAVLVRGGGEKAERLPLAKGMTLRAGDRIETSAPRSESRAPGHEPGAKSHETRAARPVHAALELWSGATVDLAGGTKLEMLGESSAKLTEGLLCAEVSGSGSPGGGRDARADRPDEAPVLRFGTPFADVDAGAGRFDLFATEQLARLRVEDGSPRLSNRHGQRKVPKLHESTARSDAAPSAPAGIKPELLWRGRAGDARATDAANLLVNPGFEQWGKGWTNLMLPKEQFEPGRNLVEGQFCQGKLTLQLQADRKAARSVSQSVPVTAGACYQAAAWVKTSDPGHKSFDCAVNIEWRNAAGAALCREKVGALTGSHGWTRFTQRLKAPAGATAALYEILGSKDADGSAMAWFDQCEFSRSDH